MKWATRITGSPDCARQPLDQLLTGQLDGRAGEHLAAHLDACETCQQRLTQLAADPSWWFDASRWLEPDAPGDDSCFDDLNGCEIDEFDANPVHERDLLASGLLEESTNPAMLGALGRYEVKRVIGAGGTGVVLQATDTELGRTVAIKVLAPTLAAHGPARKRFARESQAVAAVAHENVVTVHHVEGSGRVPYLVMQYIDGDSLQERVIRDGPLDVTTTLRMTAQLASAPAAAHDQGLVHRDVKPANILVGPAGQRVWMTDFGLARAVDDASLTRTGFIAGTPHYMSPEQAPGDRQDQQRSVRLGWCRVSLPLEPRPSLPQYFDSASDQATPFASAQHAPQTVEVRYMVQRAVQETTRTPDGRIQMTTRYVNEVRSSRINVADDLEQLELPPEGKRAAVLAVTAARHPNLLDKLKTAKTPEEKESSLQSLQENYTEHYAVETWWREQKLAELQARLEELQEQVTQRQNSEEKYVSATMTIAELWAEGIGISPPTPGRLPTGSTARVLPAKGGLQSYGVPPIPLPGPQNSFQHSSGTQLNQFQPQTQPAGPDAVPNYAPTPSLPGAVE